jgi:hypothetical protein
VNPIQPIHLKAQGAAVANLHAGLLFLIRNQSGISDNDRRTLEQGLASDLHDQVYKDWTTRLVSIFQEQLADRFQLVVNGDVDQATADALNKLLSELGAPTGDPPIDPANYHVKGQVQWVDGRLAAGVVVRAFDKDLRHEEVLGQAKTDVGGNYDIAYSASQFRRAEKKGADLVIRVFRPTEEPLGSSPVVFDAQQTETINVLLGGTVLLGPSEFTRIVADVKPLLDGVAVADLTTSDIEFLSGESNWSKEFLGIYAAAAGLSQQTKLPAEVFYGFAREQLPTYLNSLLAQSADTQRGALEAAVSDNIIPASVSSTIDSVLTSLRQLIVRQAFEPGQGGKTSLGALIGTSLSDAAQQTEVLTRYVNHTGTIEEFWAGLRSDPVYAGKVDDLQFTLQLGTLTANHLPLVSALQQMRQNKDFRNLRDLIRLEPENWKAMIAGQGGHSGVGFPPEVPGANDDEKATNYAAILTRMVRDAFPTAAVAHAISRDDIPGKADLTTFFTTNAAFDLGTTHIGTYLADNPAALADVSDPTILTRQLQSFQRLHRLTSDYSQMSGLLKENLYSAQAISRMGETAFVSQFGPAWGANQASLVFANAAQTATTALMLVGEYGPAFNSVGTAVLAIEPQPAAGIPDLENLFGSLELCDCEECRTVLSPAAYLVDILAFLKHRASKTAGRSAKDILFQRRPDLGQVELTCENTNTPLPYVDLVNELLEDCIAPPSVPVARQTTGTAPELAANPQYLNQDAYDQLRSEVFPWHLPFHLASADVSTYLDHLGVPHHELMRTFQKLGASPDPIDAAIAADYLGLSTAQRQIITGTPLTPTRQPWEYWGYPAAAPGTWLTDLRRVRLFLDKSGLTYANLVDLLEAAFINPNLGIVILSIDSSDPGTCDTEKLRISNAANNLSNAEFESLADRVHRFVRLWRKLGWTTRELDRAISALQGTIADVNLRLDDTFLLHLSHIQRLRGEFKLSVEQLLALWAPIEIAGEDSLYQRLFQNPAVLKPVDAAFHLNGAELDIVTSAPASAKISMHAATILAALGLSAADLSMLTATEVTDDLLNLANLSRLYRVTLLAKGVKFSIQDTITLKQLAGVDPFDVAHTANTLRFAELATKLRASGFSLAELDYVLRHNVSSFSAIPPAEAGIAQVLDEIRKGLQKIDDETAVTPDPGGDSTGKKLALLLWESSVIEQAIATLNDAVVYGSPLASLPAGLVFPASLEDKISYVSAATIPVLRFKGAMTTAELASLLGLSVVSDYHTAVQDLFAAPRAFVAAQMRAFEIPTFSAPLATPPPMIPDEFKGALFYDASGQLLRFVGFMTMEQRDTLWGVSTVSSYRAAITGLFTSSAAFVPAPENTFLIPSDVSALFDITIPAAERFHIVLEKLLSHLRAQSRNSLIKQKLGDALKLDLNLVEPLLTRWVSSPGHPADTSLTDFLAPAFAQSDSQVMLTAAGFPDQFRTFTLLHKVALVLRKFKVTVNELTWLFDYGPGVGWLDLNALPLVPGSGSVTALFAGWERLVDLVQLRDQLPLGESVLSDVFSAARATAPDKPALLAGLSLGALWNPDDLRFLDGSQGFGFAFPTAYQDERSLARLRACFVLMKKLGASAEECLAWAKADMTPDDAASIKQTAKAKYDEAQWLDIARPLRDVVREKQRAALVAYLVAHPDSARGQTWKDVNGLFEYFLIDVEMSPCQLTSRIKQAISAVQSFTQRCLMNLEPSVQANAQSDTHWREWAWMKNYRIWGANREIFLYPENFVEPEWRDDKSPFFKDLENDLLQNEVTQETAEAALLSYVEKLDGVAQQEIVGMYDQQEKDAHGNTVVDLLHVFGRTRNSPHHYYYRQRVDSAYWTPWEIVALDIEGEHIIPVTWNRRLCVFWPIFTEKSKPDPRPGLTGSTGDPLKWWEIQIAWSEFKNKKWSAKRISKAAVVADFGRSSFNVDKEAFIFKGLFTNGDLAIRIYTSFVMAGEGKGDGAGLTLPRLQPFAEFSFSGCNSEPAVVTVGTGNLTNTAPLVVPSWTFPRNMKFQEDWRDPTSGRG